MNTNGCQRAVQKGRLLCEYRHGVNASALEGLHAGIMVIPRVDAVYTNSIHAELLEEWGITSTGCSIGERVKEVCRFGEGGVWVVAKFT